MNRHCGETKPHAEHEWWDDSAMPIVYWDRNEPVPTPTEMPSMAEMRMICPGTRRRA